MTDIQGFGKSGDLTSGLCILYLLLQETDVLTVSWQASHEGLGSLSAFREFFFKLQLRTRYAVSPLPLC